jgi:hypothetical protein
MSISHYIIHELFDPEDNRYWRLHWFEQLTMNQRTREPLLEALFVPLIRDDLDIYSNPPELLDNSSYDFNQSKLIEIGGGQLPMLHMGLLLHQGRPQKRPRYQRKIFNLFIGEEDTEILPVLSSRRVGLSKKKIYDVPYSQYMLTGTNNYVRCLHIKVPPGRSDKITKIIIPCAEVIRCYYGNSSELFREILTNGLAGSPNRVFDPDRTIYPDNKEGKTPFICLTPYVKKWDAPIVALFAFSPYARAYGRNIFTSAHKNSKRRDHRGELQGFVPEANLPYVNQETRLILCGKVIGSERERSFLTFYIESDSASFPFKFFEYQQEGDDSIHTFTDPNLPDAGRGVLDEEKEEVVTINDEVEELIIRTDKEPSPNKEQVEELMCEDKFPDLKKKRWRERERGRSRKRPPRQEPIFIQGHDETVEFSTAPFGAGGSKVTSLSLIPDFGGDEEKVPEIVEVGLGTEEIPVETKTGEEPKEWKPRRSSERGKALRASYELFADLVTLLNRVLPDKVSCEFVKIPRTGNAVEVKRVISSFPTELKGNPLPWSTVAYDDEPRARRLVAARGVCHERHYFYLLEIEPPQEGCREDEWRGDVQNNVRRYTLLLIHLAGQGFSDMGAENLRKVLVTCAENRGAWLKDKQLGQFERKKFKHTSCNKIVFVGRILEYLWRAGLLILSDEEVAQYARKRKKLKADELPSTDERPQDNEESQDEKRSQYGALAEILTLSEQGELSQYQEIDKASHDNQPTAVDASSEVRPLGSDERTENCEPLADMSSDVETSDEEALIEV